MLVADEYLRNRASIAARNHFLAQLRVVLDVDFAELQILLSQETLGSLAVRTPVRHIHHHGGVGHLELSLPPGQGFANGRVSFSQAIQPPRTMNTLSKPTFLTLPRPLPP